MRETYDIVEFDRELGKLFHGNLFHIIGVSQGNNFDGSVIGNLFHNGRDVQVTPPTDDSFVDLKLH